MSAISTLLVEGVTDERIVRRLLPPDQLVSLKVVVCHGTGGVISYAQSALSLGRRSVAVLLDADTVQSQAIRERRRELEELIGLYGNAVPHRLILAVPEIEVVFFAEPTVLERVFGWSLPPDQAIRGEYEPKRILSQLFKQHPTIQTVDALLAALTDEDVAELRTRSPIREVSEFVANVLNGQLVPA